MVFFELLLFFGVLFFFSFVLICIDFFKFWVFCFSFVLNFLEVFWNFCRVLFKLCFIFGNFLGLNINRVIIKIKFSLGKLMLKIFMGLGVVRGLEG